MDKCRTEDRSNSESRRSISAPHERNRARDVGTISLSLSPFRPLPLRYHYRSDPNSCRNASPPPCTREIVSPPTLVPSSATMHLSGAPVDARRFRPIAGDFAGSRTSSTILLCEQYLECSVLPLRTHENNGGSDLLANMPDVLHGNARRCEDSRGSNIAFKGAFDFNYRYNFCATILFFIDIINEYWTSILRYLRIAAWKLIYNLRKYEEKKKIPVAMKIQSSVCISIHAYAKLSKRINIWRDTRKTQVNYLSFSVRHKSGWNGEVKREKVNYTFRNRRWAKGNYYMGKFITSFRWICQRYL